jgi:uncharacterized phage infection (PIP) family protein YhgE
MENLKENKGSKVSKRDVLKGLAAIVGWAVLGSEKPKADENTELAKLHKEIEKIKTDINELLQKKFDLDRDTNDTMELIDKNPDHNTQFPDYKVKKKDYQDGSNTLESMVYEEQEKLDKALENLKLTYLEISEYYDDETKLVDKLTELRKISTQLREILDTQNKGGSSL